MKMLHDPSERVKSGLKEAITLLCKTGLNFQSEMSIDGLLGITLDQNEVFLVRINEVIKNPRDFQVTSSGGGLMDAGEISGEQEGSITDEAEDLSVHSSRVCSKREKVRGKRKKIMPPLLNIPHPIYSKKPCLNPSRPSSNGSADTSASEGTRDLELIKGELEEDVSNILSHPLTQITPTDLTKNRGINKVHSKLRENKKNDTRGWESEDSSMKLPIEKPVTGIKSDNPTEQEIIIPLSKSLWHRANYQNVPSTSTETVAPAINLKISEAAESKSLGNIIEDTVENVLRQESESRTSTPDFQPSLVVAGTSDRVEEPSNDNSGLPSGVKVTERPSEVIMVKDHVKGEPMDTCSTPSSSVGGDVVPSGGDVWGSSSPGLIHHSQSACTNTSLVAQALASYPATVSSIPDYDAHSKWLQTIAAYVGQTPAPFPAAYSPLSVAHEVCTDCMPMLKKVIKVKINQNV